MEKRDLSKPQQRVGVETGFKSLSCLGTHPSGMICQAAPGPRPKVACPGWLTGILERQFHPPTRTTEQAALSSEYYHLKLAPFILFRPFPFYEQIYMHKERVGDCSLI